MLLSAKLHPGGSGQEDFNRLHPPETIVERRELGRWLWREGLAGP